MTKTPTFSILAGLVAVSSAAVALPGSGFRGPAGPEPALENIGGSFSNIDPEQGVIVAAIPEAVQTGLQPIPLPGPGMLGLAGLASIAAIRRRRNR